MDIKNRKEKACSFKDKTGSFRKKAGLKVRIFLFRYWEWIISALVLAVGLFIRYRVIRRPYGDVRGCLFPWARQIQNLGFRNFYKVSGSNYSTFYLFFLGLLSLLPSEPTVTVSGYTFAKNWRIGLKSVNYLFDLSLAIGVFFALKELTKEKHLPFIGAWICFLLPIQMANSALWGQCDNFWTSNIVWALYFLLKGKDGLSWFRVGFGISVKLHRIFIFPLLVYFWLKRKLSLWKIVYGLLGFFLTCLPAFFCGAGISDVLSFITSQTGSFPQLTLGCANRWHFLYSFSGQELAIINKGSTFLGLALIARCFVAVLYHNPDREDKTTFILVSCFLVNIVPFFLPHRHERYFFAFDILVLLYCLTAKKDYYLLLLTQLSSAIAYYHYLSQYKEYFIPSMGESSVSIASAINLFVLGFFFMRIRKLPKGLSLKEEAQEMKTRPIDEKKSDSSVF